LVLNSIQFVFKLMPTVAKMQFSFLIFLKNKGNALVSHFKPLRLMLKNMLSLGLFGDSSFVSNKKHKKTFPSQETVPNSRTICRADYFFSMGQIMIKFSDSFRHFLLWGNKIFSFQRFDICTLSHRRHCGNHFLLGSAVYLKRLK
jgi:hypothetical protein